MRLSGSRGPLARRPLRRLACPRRDRRPSLRRPGAARGALLAALLALAALPGLARPAAALPPESPFAWAWPWFVSFSPDSTECAGLARAPGGVYVVSHRWNASDETESAHLARVGADGGTVWAKTAVMPGYMWVRPRAATSDRARDLVVVGHCYRDDTDLEGWVASYAPDGGVRWRRAWDGPEESDRTDLLAVACDREGNVLAAGVAWRHGRGDDVVVLKYGRDGRLRWARLYGTTGRDYAADLGVDAAGNVYVTGSVGGRADGRSFLWTASWSAAGSLRWSRRVGGLGLPYAGGGLRVRGDAVYVSGFVRIESEGDLPVAAKYGTDGRRRWERAVAPLCLWTSGRPAVDRDGRMGFVSVGLAAIVPPDETQVGSLTVLPRRGVVGQVRQDWIWSTLGGPLLAWPVTFTAVAVDGAGRWYAAGALALQPYGETTDAFVVRWPPATTTPWHADRHYRVHTTGGLGSFDHLLLAGSSLYAGGAQRAAGTSVTLVQRLDLGAP